VNNFEHPNWRWVANRADEDEPNVSDDLGLVEANGGRAKPSWR
jgi:hypothetical protein